MQIKWQDLKVGDIMKDGSIITQIHRTHDDYCCKVIYDTDKEFICSFNHILLIDVSNLPIEGKIELEENCSFVPLEENFKIECDEPLSDKEKLIIDQFCHNEHIDIEIDCINALDTEVYDFHFKSKIKRIYITNIIIKQEPQKVDENTYWLNCVGIQYLMNKYNVDLYCNDNIINSIDAIGQLPCFCISTNTGKYET